ncbi:MAG: hypothetical protein AB1Z98_26360 [Nannocystaceae bacterium]
MRSAWLGCLGALCLLLACGDDGSGGGPAAATEGATEGGTATADESTGEPLPVPVASVAELLVPFDSETDAAGPASWDTQYGKSPEIVAVAHGRTIDVLVQDYSAGDTGSAYLLRLEPLNLDYVITSVIEPPMLDRIMGLAWDANDNLYVASGAAEAAEITLQYPAPGQYRSGVVRVVKMNAAGEVQFDTDLDPAREATGEDPELLINPMVAATSRLTMGPGSVALVHGINTNPDDEGVRHQKALTTHLHSVSGDVVRTSSIWVSHSFDQRMLHDGTGFIEMHLGDAYPRDIAFARVEPDSGTYSLLGIKGETGANNTFTRLGNVRLIEDDPTYGYLALYATESTPGLEPVDPGAGTIAGSRDLAIVRVRRDFEVTDAASGGHLDSALPDSFDVQSGGAAKTNRLRWLTSYQAETAGFAHAERPKLIPLGDDTYVVAWEHWSTPNAFDGTWAMVIDATGSPLVEARKLSDSHLPRGDDGFALDGEAAWITGVAEARQLIIHIVDAELSYRTVIVD